MLSNQIRICPKHCKSPRIGHRLSVSPFRPSICPTASASLIRRKLPFLNYFFPFTLEAANNLDGCREQKIVPRWRFISLQLSSSSYSFAFHFVVVRLFQAFTGHPIAIYRVSWRRANSPAVSNSCFMAHFLLLRKYSRLLLSEYGGKSPCCITLTNRLSRSSSLPDSQVHCRGAADDAYVTNDAAAGTHSITLVSSRLEHCQVLNYS